MNLIAAWFVAGTILGIAQPDITEAIRKDRAALQGTWKVVAAEDNGEKVPATEIKDLFLTFRADAIEIREGGKVAEKFAYLLDPTKKPKEIDLTYTAGPKKGTTDRGIYQIDGDMLRICIQTNKDNARPRDFAAPVNSRNSLVTMQRSKE